MTTSSPALKDLIGAFGEARGVETDETWAGAVAVRLLVEPVNRDLARGALQEALDLVRQTQESPEELFGAPRAWADAQVEQWRADGRPVEPPEPDTSWRDVPVVTMVTGAVISALLLGLLLVRGEWRFEYTWGAVLLPTFSALATIGALTVFESVLQRARRLVAVAAGLGVVGLGVLGLATIFYLGQDHPIGEGSLWWFAALMVAHAVLAWVFARVIPDAPRRRGAGGGSGGARTGAGLDDEAWLRQVAGILRLRAGLPEARIQQHLAEARAHAAESGQPLAREFGRPASYASRFPKDRAADSRRRLWAYTAMVPLTAFLALDDVIEHGWSWSNVNWLFVAVFALILGTVVSGWLRARRPRPHPHPDRASGVVSPAPTGRPPWSP